MIHLTTICHKHIAPTDTKNPTLWEVRFLPENLREFYESQPLNLLFFKTIPHREIVLTFTMLSKCNICEY